MTRIFSEFYVLKTFYFIFIFKFFFSFVFFAFALAFVKHCCRDGIVSMKAIEHLTGLSIK